MELSEIYRQVRMHQANQSQYAPVTPRIVYEVLDRTGTTPMSLSITLGQEDTKMHTLCQIETSNDALNGLNRII